MSLSTNVNETSPARRLKLLVLASAPISTALSILSLFLPFAPPSDYCIPAVLFTSLLCHLAQAIYVLIARSIVGVVSLTSVSFTATTIGLEFGGFILIALTIDAAAPTIGTEAILLSWTENKFIIPVVVLLWLHIAVLCATFAHMIVVRCGTVTQLKDAAGFPTLRNLGVICALCSWPIFILSMINDLGAASYYIFPLTSGLTMLYYTITTILNWGRLRPALFTSGWALAPAFVLGLAETSFFCFWLAGVCSVVDDELYGPYYEDTSDSHRTLIAISVFVFVKMVTLMALFVGGLTLRRAAGCESSSVELAGLKAGKTTPTDLESLHK